MTDLGSSPRSSLIGELGKMLDAHTNTRLLENYKSLVSHLFAESVTRGDVHTLANAHSHAREGGYAPEILNEIEAALNKGLDHCGVRPSSRAGERYSIIDLVKRDILPESALVKAAAALGEELCVEELFSLREKPSSTETVREACDDALISAVVSLESSRRFSDIAAFRGGRTLPEKVGKACDEALIRKINALCGEANPDPISALAQQAKSEAVAAAAGAALAKLGNVTDEQFAEALVVLVKCGELTTLARIRKDTGLPAAYIQVVDAAMMNAMDIAVGVGWNMAGIDAACNSDYLRNGKAPFEAIVTDENIPGKIREKAQGLLGKYSSYTYHPPEDTSAEVEAQRPKLEAAMRLTSSYLLQQRDPSRGDGVLSQGIVPRPASEGERAPGPSPLRNRQPR